MNSDGISPIKSSQRTGILLVDDDNTLLKKYSGLILRKLLPSFPKIFIEVAPTIEEALSRDHSNIACIVLDQFFENETKFKNGIDAIPHIQTQIGVPVLVHTSSGDIADAVRAVKNGATNYIFKGQDTTGELLANAIAQILIDRKLKAENEILLRGGELSLAPEKFTYKSKAMKYALEDLDKIATSDYPVLLLGETGVGKSFIAKEIHRLRGGHGPFIEININEPNMNIIESELFGSIRGAFTGAVNKEGLFKLANGGTLFLDEIGDAPLELQNKILTAIETKVFSKVGAPAGKIKVDFKLITATNKNPRDLISERKLKHDFYARIRGYEITIPSIRERTEDIPELIKTLLPKVSKMAKVPVAHRQLPQDFTEWVMKNPPEFNVRGLEDVLKDLLTFAPLDADTKRPLLKHWRGFKPFRDALRFSYSIPSTLTWHDVLGDKMQLLTADFPGFKNFCQKLEDKIIRESSEKFTLMQEASRVSGISRSTLFRRGLSKGALKR